MPCKYYGPDDNPSILFDELYNHHKGDEKAAVKDWLMTFSSFFKSFFEFILKNNVAQGTYINGEPKLEHVLKAKQIAKNGERGDDQLTEAFARDLSRRFNVPVEFVSEQDARQMVPNYSYQPAFYQNGRAYLVKNRISRNAAIHEIFAHPFLDIVEKENKALFANLSEKVMANKEIMERTQRFYPEYFDQGKPTNEGVKEAIIYAIELEADNRVQSKGLLAVIQSFWKAIERRMKSWLGVPSLSPNMTIQDLTDLAFNGTLDLSQVPATADIKFKKESSSLQERIYDLIRKANRMMSQVVGKDGKEEYVNSMNPDAKYTRLTEFTRDTFDYRNKTSEEYAQDEASANFVQQGKSKSDKYRVQDGTEYTYDEWVTQVKIKYENIRTYGKIGHLYMELIFGGDRERIQKEINALVTEIPGVRSAFTGMDQFKYLLQPERIAQIKDEFGIEVNDRILSETILHSDLLKIATRADGIIVKENGQVILGDYKFGNLYAGANTAHIFKWATDQAQSSMQKTRLNDAKLEVAYRAMIMKMQNPEIVFEDMFVAHVSEMRGARKESIMLQDYLDMIANYYKNQQPEVYRELLKKGVLNSDNYWGKSKSLNQAESEMGVLHNKTKATYARTLYNELLVIQNQLKSLNSEYISAGERRVRQAQLEDERQQLIESILSISSEKSAQQLFTEAEDISMPDVYFGNNYDVKNELAQVYFEILREKKQIARDNIRENMQQYEKVAKDVLDEYLNRKGIPKLLNRVGLNSLLGAGFKYHTEDGQGIYDFAYVKREGYGGKGYYLVTPQDEKWNTLSDAQKAYLTFLEKSMNDQYKKAVGSRVVMRTLDKNETPQTKAQILGKPAELPTGFLPRLPVQTDEYTEKYGLGKGLAKRFVTDVFEDYIQDDYTSSDVKRDVGMPVKYMANDHSIVGIVEREEHSFDLETSYRQFMNNLYMVEEMDEALALGRGIEGWVKAQKNAADEPKMANLGKFIEGQLQLHTVDTKQTTKWSKKGLTFVMNGKKMRVNFDRIIRALKTGTTYASMWFQPLNAAANGGLILTMNHKNAAIGSMIKRFKFLGIDDREIDFTTADLVKAEGMYGELQKDMIAGNAENNKLYQLLKQFNYMPDAYDYAIRKGDRVASKNALIDASTPMFLNTLVEDFGSITILGAVLNHMQFETKDGRKVSAYDAYELVDAEGPGGKTYKKLQFRKDIKTRGVIENKITGEKKEIRELTSQEITTLKRISQRIHGAYRQDERSNAELYAVGQMFLQFKKYLPTLLRNAFGSAYKDRAQGYYQTVFGEDGKPQLIEVEDPETGEKRFETKLEWFARLNEGRYLVMANWLLATLGMYGKNSQIAKLMEKIGVKAVGYNENYKWDNLTPEQKKAFMQGVTSIASFAVTMFAFGLMFDDDDKDKMIYRKAKRFQEDMMEGIWPNDLLRMLKSPVPSLNRAYNLSSASSSFLADLLTGERQKDGKLHGQTMVEKSLPVFSSIYNIDKLMGESGIRLR